MTGKTLIYRFDNVQVDVQRFRVSKAGTVLPLEPKAFEVLVFLIGQHGRLVEKNELLDAVWKDAFVTPNALTRVIAHLRRTLGDDAREAKYIETVPTRGYRFIAEVEVKNESGDGEETSSPPPRPLPGKAEERRKYSLIAALPVLAAVLALVAIAWLRRAPAELAERAGVLRTVQVTNNAGLDIFPAFSPDESAIAYSSLRNGSFEVFIRQLAPGGRELQVTADGEQNVQPAWSPDGRMIAYHSRQRGGIRLIPALGGVAMPLTDFGSRPAWSRDGKWIAFQSDAQSDLSQTGFGAFAPSTLWLIPASGGTARQLTQPDQPAGGHGAPAWSPDGRRIVFVSYNIGYSALWSVAPDGSDLKLLQQGSALFFDPVFSPDGKYLYVSTASGNFRLWKSRISPVTGLPEGTAVEIANTGNALARHLTIAPDGRRIAYSSLVMSNNIGSVMIAPASGEAAGEPVLLTQDTAYRKTSQSFSPDGRTIAYSVWRMGADGEVWLMKADGSDPVQLTTEPAGVLGWLPSGDQVALVSKTGSGVRLWKLEVKTGRTAPLTGSSVEARLGRLSPDGKQIAFNGRANGTINVQTFELESGALKQLTFDRELMGFPVWSPDSRFLAVEVKRGDDTHIAVIPKDGGTPEQLTRERGQSWPGSWSPDGDRIAFAGLRNGVWNIWWVSRRTKEQREVTRYTRPNIYVRYPAWSPRGNQIVYEYAETTGNIWLADLK
ncbi:MAG TPA: LpqB family beta-propeller domain-containing protein [Blastocatellia bacterium]|nr:LpqB family beta-propeller domain-containing protein [Blastocatellia bacterium]